jgi:hypothetical protein
MADYLTAANQSVGLSFAGQAQTQGFSVQTEKNVPKIASQLHELASRIGGCNEQISALLERIYGPSPQSAAGTEKQPEPSGALMVATFGVERIRRQIDLLCEKITRLESIA